jgi:Raf kinase inhibitor-like YbhB/YbcL family protein
MEIPLMHKCAQNKPAGGNVSPPLSWTPGPAGTKSYAVTLNHVASGSAHWALWDIPATTTSLPQDVMHALMPAVPAGSKQTMHNGFDGFTGAGYLGPCPQAVNSRQMYRYAVWALNTETLAGVTTASTTAAVQTAIKNAALAGTGTCSAPNAQKACAELVGTQIQQP